LLFDCFLDLPLLLFPVVGQGVRRVLFRDHLLRLAGDFALLFGKFHHPGQVLDFLAVPVHLVADRLQLAFGIPRVVAGLVEFRFALPRIVLEQRVLHFLARLGGGVGGLIDVVGLRRVHAFLHLAGEFLELGFGPGEFLRGFLEILAGSFIQLRFADFPAAPIHFLAAFTGGVERFLDGFSSTLVFLPQFLTGERFRTGFDTQLDPLRVADPRPAQTGRPAVLRSNTQAELFHSRKP